MTERGGELSGNLRWGERATRIVLGLFPHSVSDSTPISCNFAHNLFQTALQVCPQDSLRLDRSRECGLDSARSGGLLLSFTEFNSAAPPSTCSLLQTAPMKRFWKKVTRKGKKPPHPPQQSSSSRRHVDNVAGPPASQTGLDGILNGEKSFV